MVHKTVHSRLTTLPNEDVKVSGRMERVKPIPRDANENGVAAKLVSVPQQNKSMRNLLLMVHQHVGGLPMMSLVYVL